MASVDWDYSVGALLGYNAVTVIIVLDVELGVDCTNGGTTFIELAAVSSIRHRTSSSNSRSRKGQSLASCEEAGRVVINS